MLNFLKALWQGAGQYTDILEQLKSSGKFWKQLSNSVSLIASMEAPLHENYVDLEALTWAYRFRCQSVIFELMAYDTFLHEKLLHAEFLVKQAAQSSKDRTENAVSTEKSKALTDCDLKDILSSWSESSFFGNLIKSFSSCEHDNEIHIRAKVNFNCKFLFFPYFYYKFHVLYVWVLGICLHGRSCLFVFNFCLFVFCFLSGVLRRGSYYLLE